MLQLDMSDLKLLNLLKQEGWKKKKKKKKLIEQLVLLSSNILDTKGEGKGLLIILSLS